MLFIEKEKNSKFKVNLGAIDGKENVYVEVEYEDKKENAVKVDYWIGINNYGIKEYVVGYEVKVEKDDDVEETIFNEVKRLHENGYFYRPLALLYENLECLEINRISGKSRNRNYINGLTINNRKIINGMMFTDKAIKTLTKEYEVNLEELTTKKLKILLIEANKDRKIIVDGNYEYAVWTKEDMKAICSQDNMKYFYKIEEFEIYVAQSGDHGEYYIYGKVGETYAFLNDYLALSMFDDLEFCKILFNKCLKSICWYSEENELKQAIDNELEKQKNENEYDEDYI